MDRRHRHRHHCTLGRNGMKSTSRVLGHLLVRLLDGSHSSLICLLRTACFARPLRCAALICSLACSLVFSSSGSSFLGSGSEGNRRIQSPVEYRENLYVPTSIHTYIRTYVYPCIPPMAIWSQPQRDLEGTAVRMAVRTDVLYSTGLCLLQFPSELLLCSHNSYRYKILKQGKSREY